MSPHRLPKVSGPAGALLAGVAAALLLSPTCLGRQPGALRAGKMTLRCIGAADARTGSSTPGARAGDFVFEGAGLHVVVGGMGRGGEMRGAVVGVTAGHMPHSHHEGHAHAAQGHAPVVQGLVVRVGAGGQSARAFVPEQMLATWRDGHLTVRSTGHLELAGQRVRVTRELGIDPEGRWLSARTRVAAPDDAAVKQLAVTERLVRDGIVPFVAGTGHVHDTKWHETGWLGHELDDASLAFDRRGEVFRARVRYVEHGTSRFAAGVDARSEAHTVEAGASWKVRSTLALAAGPLAEAVRRMAHARGDEFPEVDVQLAEVPDGARVHAHTATPDAEVDDDPQAHGQPVLISRVPSDGHVRLPLPPVRREIASRHRLFATAYGHAPSASKAVREPGARVELRIPRGSAIRIQVRGSGGEPMPGRARIRGLEDTDDPQLGPSWHASGAGNAVVTAKGDTRVPVPPGRYEVLVGRGPEWSLARKTVEVTETYRPRVHVQLRHLIDPGPWIPCDFHVHAAPSGDSKVTLEDRVASLAAEGVRFAVASDHNHVTDYGAAVRELGMSDLDTVPGVEITTWSPQFGHFNAYPFPHDPDAPRNGAPRYESTNPMRLFSDLHEIDPRMVIQVNHPRLEPRIGYFDLLRFDARSGDALPGYSRNYDVIEVFNGFDLARLERVQRVFTDWLAILMRGRRVVANGSSDSHRISYQWAGYPRTYVRVPEGPDDSGRAVTEALKAGRAFVTSGPFLELTVEGRGPGRAVRARDETVEVHVRVRAPPWMSVDEVLVYRGARVAHKVDADSAGESEGTSPPVVRIDRTLELEITRDTFVLAWARGDDPLDTFFGRGGIYPLAFTNPVWVDGNGDARVPWLNHPLPNEDGKDGGTEGADPGF